MNFMLVVFYSYLMHYFIVVSAEKAELPFITLSVKHFLTVSKSVEIKAVESLASIFLFIRFQARNFD